MVNVRVKSYLRRKPTGGRTRVKTHTRKVKSTPASRARRRKAYFNIERERIPDIIQTFRVDEGVKVRGIHKKTGLGYKAWDVIGKDRQGKWRVYRLVEDEEATIKAAFKDIKASAGDYVEAGHLKARYTNQDIYNLIDRYGPADTLAYIDGKIGVTDRFDMRYWRID